MGFMKHYSSFGAPQDGQKRSLTLISLPQYAQNRDFNPVPHWGHQSNDDATLDAQFGQVACKVETAAGRAVSFASVPAATSENNRLPNPLPHMGTPFRLQILLEECKDHIMIH